MLNNPYVRVYEEIAQLKILICFSHDHFFLLIKVCTVVIKNFVVNYGLSVSQYK